MDRDQLRAVQAPLKQRYREDPESALITLRADGSLEDGLLVAFRQEQRSSKPAFTQRQEGPDCRPARETCFFGPSSGSGRRQQLVQTNMTPKDQFRYSVLSAIHDEALSISDAIDQAYGEHVAGKDTEIERLRARSAKFEQLLSEALRQGWLDESKTSPSWLQEALAAIAK